MAHRPITPRRDPTHTDHDDRRGPAWPGRPGVGETTAPTLDEVTSAYGPCEACRRFSTLVYRCSACGHDMVDNSVVSYAVRDGTVRGRL